MQPLEAHREAMPDEERPQGTGPELPIGELPGDDQRRAAEGKWDVRQPLRVNVLS